MIIKIKKSVALSIAAVLTIFAVCVYLKPNIKEATAPQSIRIPIIMYHQISKNASNIGKYVISADELEKDLVYLKENGYQTINVKELVDYVEGKTALPEKSVMLTFDDGYETGFTVLYPMLKKYDMKAVLSVVGSLTKLYTENEDHNDRYSYLDEEEIRLLSLSEEIEIQNHSYDMHYCEKGKRKGINKLYGESDDAYEKAISDDLEKMQSYLFKLTGRNPEAMTYPFGEYNKDTLGICKGLGFKVTFTCEERVNTVTKYRRNSLYNLGRFNRSGKAIREDFFKKALELS